MGVLGKIGCPFVFPKRQIAARKEARGKETSREYCMYINNIRYYNIKYK